MSALASTADRLLSDARAQVQERAAGAGDLQAATSELLDEVIAFTARYVALGEEAARPFNPEAIAVALWTLHTWALDACDCTPYLCVMSEEKRSGKTRLLEVLRLLVRAPWHVNSVTAPALFRKVEAEQPTMLLDECDAIFAANEALRGILNAGNRRGSSVTRCEGKTYREYPTFCPKVLSGISSADWPDTVVDRSITITMHRQEGHVQRLRARDAELAALPLQGALELWGRAAVQRLAFARPLIPDALTDRAADAWEPLLAIAELAGGDWSSRSEAAAEALSGTEAVEAPPTPMEVAQAVRAAGNSL
jgi:Protein of unknown function (DUF3631)